jgi:hypothetical protein
VLGNPPGIRSPQLSTSIARANADNPAAISTTQNAPGPSVVEMPAAKNAAMPSCAMASADAFEDEVKGRSALEDRTTRIGRRVRKDGITSGPGVGLE